MALGAVTVPEGCIHVEFPNGDLLYNDDTHAYFAVKEDGSRGKRLTSVSSLCKPFDWKPDHLMRWAAKRNLEGVAILAADGLSQEEPDDIHSGLQFLHSADSIWSALENGKLTYNHLRDAKATVGTNVHLALEDLAAGKLPDAAMYPHDEQPYVKALLDWWIQREPTVLNAEQFVYSAQHGYAGRFDLRAEIDGEVVLVDAKTSGFISTAFHVQLAGYDLAAIECGVGASDRQWVLQLSDEGEWAEVQSQATHADFVTALTVYRRAAEIEKAARAERKAA